MTTLQAGSEGQARRWAKAMTTAGYRGTLHADPISNDAARAKASSRFWWNVITDVTRDQAANVLRVARQIPAWGGRGNTT